MTPEVTPRTDGRRTAAAARRRERKKEIIAATRSLFDERGMRDAQIEDIAQAVGINRAIVYRHFTGKEELFALTLVTYLDELQDQLVSVTADVEDPVERLTRLVTAFIDYGSSHPAFIDCAQALMRRSGPELLEEISEGAMFRLGKAMSGCLGTVERTVEYGNDKGAFAVEDPVLLANLLYASGLGCLQLARVGILVTEDEPGMPILGEISTTQAGAFLVGTALAHARKG